MQANRVCVLDLETTGFDEQKDEVLEVAAIFGQITAEGFVPAPGVRRVVRVLPFLKPVETWHPAVVEMHGRSGLLAECVKKAQERGNRGLTEWQAEKLAEADDMLTRASNRHWSELTHAKGTVPAEKLTLVGNTVHFDLRFVRRLFPKFAADLHYRVIDVSTLISAFEPMGYERMTHGETPHRAEADAEQSIAELNRALAWARGPK